METPSEVEPSDQLSLLEVFFETLNGQADALLAMSALGLTGIAVFTMMNSRSFGVWIYLFLIVSGLLFIVSLSAGIVIKSASTGFFYEVIAETSGCSRSTAIACFLDSDEGYGERLDIWGKVQFYAGIIGFVWLAVPWIKIYCFDRSKAS